MKYVGKTTLDIEAEKAEKELTFKPKINLSRQRHDSIVVPDVIRQPTSDKKQTTTKRIRQKSG